MGALYLYISAFIAQLSFLIGSTAVTWSSPMLVKLNGTDDNPLGYKISKLENSFLASGVTLGAIIGSIIFGMVATKVGRKPLLLFLGFPFLICYLIMAWAEVLWLFLACRVITGISFGGVLTILSMYCGEIAEAGNRGILSASMAVFINIGMLIPYSLGPYMPFFWFHIVLAILPAIFIVLFFIFAPESPYYLIKVDEAAAEEVLLKIRDRSKVPDLMNVMRENLKETSKASIMDILKSKALRKTLVIGFGGFTFMQLTGTAIVATYSQTIFEEVGGDIPSELCPIFIGSAQLIVSVFVSSITDRYPRKFLLTLSHTLVALVQIPFGAYFFVCVYNIGVGPILMTLLGELFPPKVKGPAISWMISYNWTIAFLLTTSFNTLNDFIGIGLLFWIFSVCGFLSTVFIKFFMIETKGKTLEEIQKELNKY